MGLLDDFKNRESKRIEAFYKKADCLTEEQIDEIIRQTFTAFYDQGLAGQTAAKSLIVKINKVIGINYVPAKGEFDKWHKDFKALELEVKKSLLVTVANDLCKMSVFTEAQIIQKVDEFLKDIPGILAGAREPKS